MPRPERCRRVGSKPLCSSFKPQGVPRGSLQEVLLHLDELEAVRLVDLEGMYQEEAAEKLGVSRQTLGNILESARKKISDAIVNGKVLNIEGGAVHTSLEEARNCPRCGRHRNRGGRGGWGKNGD